MTWKDLINTQERDNFLNAYATKIIDGLGNLFSKYDEAAERWIWELL